MADAACGPRIAAAMIVRDMHNLRDVW